MLKLSFGQRAHKFQIVKDAGQLVHGESFEFFILVVMHRIEVGYDEIG